MSEDTSEEGLQSTAEKRDDDAAVEALGFDNSRGGRAGVGGPDDILGQASPAGDTNRVVIRSEFKQVGAGTNIFSLWILESPKIDSSAAVVIKRMLGELGDAKNQAWLNKQAPSSRYFWNLLIRGGSLVLYSNNGTQQYTNLPFSFHEVTDVSCNIGLVAGSARIGIATILFHTKGYQDFQTGGGKGQQVEIEIAPSEMAIIAWYSQLPNAGQTHTRSHFEFYNAATGRAEKAIDNAGRTISLPDRFPKGTPRSGQLATLADVMPQFFGGVQFPMGQRGNWGDTVVAPPPATINANGFHVVFDGSQTLYWTPPAPQGTKW